MNRLDKLLRNVPAAKDMTETEGWAVDVALQPILRELHMLTMSGGILSKSGGASGVEESEHFAQFAMEVRDMKQMQLQRAALPKKHAKLYVVARVHAYLPCI